MFYNLDRCCPLLYYLDELRLFSVLLLNMPVSDCSCELLGVQNNDTRCDGPNGQCHCKLLVAGLQCNTCIDQYYGLLLEADQGECKRK